MNDLILMLTTFVISAISFAGGVLVGNQIRTTESLLDSTIKVSRKIAKTKPKKDETGVVKAPTPKEAEAIKDAEFREAFPQVG